MILHAADRAALVEPASDHRVVASAVVQEWNGELVWSADRVEVVARSPSAGEPPAVGAPDLQSGTLASAPEEVTFEQSFADDLGVSIGDDVTFVGADGTATTFSVVGTVLDFQDCFYPQCDPGVVWVDGRRHWRGSRVRTTMSGAAAI